MKTGYDHLRTRKAQTGLLLFPVGAFVIGIIFFFLFLTPKIDDAIGRKQVTVLKAIPEAESKLSFVDSSAKLGAWEALYDLGDHGGFYFEGGDDVRIPVDYPCDVFVYPRWGPENNGACWPTNKSVEQAFGNQLTDVLNYKYYYQHPENILTNIGYDYTFYFGQEKTIIKAKSDNVFTAMLTYDVDLSGQQKAVVASVQADSMPEDETITKCCTGECIQEVASQYYEKYGPPGMNLPYVWGGETPYGVVETQKKSRDPKSFFYGANVELTQPAGNKRSGMPTVPGFDCSGFAWWVYKHAGISQFNNRWGAFQYEAALEKDGTKICGIGDCKKAVEDGDAHPGDTIFLHPKSGGNANHIAIYIGEGKVIDATGDTRGIANRDIPARWYARMTIYRPKYNTAGCTHPEAAEDSTPAPAKPSPSPTPAATPTASSSSSDTTKAVAIDLSKVSAGTRASIDRVNAYSEMIRNHLTKEDIAAGVTESLVKALMMLESGGDPNAVSFSGCTGLMQFSAGTAFDYGLCDNKNCAGRDDRKDAEKSIAAGIRYLNKLMHRYKNYGHKDAMALTAYNAGPGLVDAAIQRSGKKDPDFWNDLLPNQLMDPDLICQVYHWSDQKKCENKAQNEIRIYAKKISDYLSYFGSPSLSMTYTAPTGEEKSLSKNNFGFYDVNPSFTTQVDYDLGVYEAVANWARDTISTCGQTQKSVVECIADQKEKQKKAYDEGVEKKKTDADFKDPLFRFESLIVCDQEFAPFRNFVEAFEDCLASGRDSCACAAPVDSLILKNGVEKIVITNETLSYESASSNVYDFYDLSERKQFLTLKLNGEETEKIEVRRDLASYIITDDKGKRIVPERFFIQKSFDSNGNTIIDIIIRSDEPVCNLEAEKQSFRFCAVGESKVPRFDPILHRLEPADVPIQFAINIKKAPPPKIDAQSIPVSGGTGAGGSGSGTGTIPEFPVDATLPPEKKCEGFGKANIDIKFATKDLMPEFSAFSGQLSSVLPPQAKVALFLSALMRIDDLPMTANVKINFNGASKDCDVKGIVYKCGAGVPTFNSDGSFDFSNPQGYIDLTPRFGGVKTGVQEPDSLIQLKDPSGLLSKADTLYGLPVLDEQSDAASFAITKCTEQLTQYKRAEGLDFIQMAALPAGYYFAFAYVDSQGNYGPATLKVAFSAPVIEQLYSQLGVVGQVLAAMQNTYSIDMDSLMNSLTGTLTSSDEYQIYQRALAVRSFDTMFQNAESSVTSQVLGEMATRLRADEAQGMMDRISGYGLSEDHARTLLGGFASQITQEESSRMFQDLSARADNSGVLTSAIQSMSVEEKRNALLSYYNDPEAVARMSEYELNQRLARGMSQASSYNSLISSFSLPQREYLMQQVTDRFPARAMDLMQGVLEPRRQAELLQSYLTSNALNSNADSELSRILAHLSPDRLKSDAYNRLSSSYGFPEGYDPLSVFSTFR
ncbi:transglycosylase SLT domain-containing protein [Candidatus Woesearchaeota archaeon]|nr:transglycosylase SLT domain-containing protein [Candidatus Woesearchaeota archaeon]